MRKAFLPLSGNVLERAAQVRQQQSMLRTLIRYTKETYQLGVINIEIRNEEEGHALVKEAQEIYRSCMARYLPLWNETVNETRSIWKVMGLRFPKNLLN